MQLRLAGLFTIGLMAGAGSSQAQSYNITDLGALPGDTISFPAGLNSLGQAAGTSANATSGIATLYRVRPNRGNIGKSMIITDEPVA
jgi:hypothetical protein